MTILVVDDQADVRQLLRTALEIEGYQILEASNAAEGLECLRRRTIHLVVTDYAMPGGTGTWMLHEATKQGLLKRIPAIIITATPDAIDVPDRFTVMGKPLDLDRFIQQVARLLHPPAAPAASPARTTAERKIELALYITAFSTASHQAQRNLLAVLERYEQSLVHLTVHNLTHDPIAGETDRIVYTPTLVKRWPTPSLWIVGSLEDAAVVDDLLVGCGVPPRGGTSHTLH